MAPLHRARREARQAEARGELAGLHEALLALLKARSIALTATQRRTITDCEQRTQLLRWVQRAATVTSARELFAARRATKRPVAPR
ncbi:hypothetical protein OV079_25900 [Nannocystis pusilla]|uniref:Uncharacterized protein n=1 Tax=Nannocystis pusilla TaxID=889268 RepID=A0A9X3ERE9_9BACT|nr:hypothetical protein [Nannocystis pusilla]MCY1008929.1 hypothetical protein [Nannocystis pusilla]